MAVASAPADTDWIDQYRSPLGKRKHMDLCKAGAFPSARKDGKKWLVRRAEIDAHILKAKKPGAEHDLDAIVAKLGIGK